MITISFLLRRKYAANRDIFIPLICLLTLSAALLLSGCSRGTEGGAKQKGITRDAGHPGTMRLPAGNGLAYVGRKICGGCHRQETELYRNSHHDLAMQPAVRQAVLGNFDNASFTYNNITSTFYKRNGKYFVKTDGPDGQPADYEIKYTFGFTPLQQYLIAMPGGRLQALSIAWDTRPKAQGGQHWFHLYPDQKIDYRDELHWTGVYQNWNYMCAECHTTGYKKNYNPDSNTYRSSWSEIDVSCEACHGPGSRHVALAGKLSSEELAKIPGRGLPVNFDKAVKGRWVFSKNASIASLDTSRDSDVLIDVCARCHSRRTTIDSGNPFNKSLYDTHVVSLLEKNLYYPDGQVDGEVYVYGSFIQSRMYAAGVNCNDCHNPHSARLRLTGNSLCLQCHKADVFNTPKHHFHKPGTAGAKCVACHMPAKKFMQIDTRYDHSFRIPRPDLSAKFGTPNTCNQCHTDKSPQWASAAIMRWYGKDSFKFHFAEAIAAARAGDADAGELLARVIRNKNLPAIVRATAMQQLGNYLGPDNLQLALNGLNSGNAMLRSASLNALAGLPVNERYRYLRPLLADPIKTVRIEAARLLAPLQEQNLPQPQKTRLDNAIHDYVAAQLVNSDRAFANVNLGNLYADTGKFSMAVTFYKRAIALDKQYVPAYVNLADLYRQTRKDEQAEKVLRRALQSNPRSAVLNHALGLTLVRMKKYQAALAYLESAARLAPDNSRFVIVYAVALNSLGSPAKAITVLSAAYRRHPRNRDLIEYLTTMQRDNGDLDRALAYAKQLVRIAPVNDPQAAGLLESVQEKITDKKSGGD